MIDVRKWKNNRRVLAAGAAVLVIAGAAGGAGAVQATRPSVEMAPTVLTLIAKLPMSSGVVTVKGRVAEVYGDRFVIQDASGRTMVAAGREARGMVGVGQPVIVQGRFDDGQLRASYLVDRNGEVAEIGPRGPRPGGPDDRGPHRPGRDVPPPPPQGCAPQPGVPGGPGAAPPPPPPANAGVPSANGAAPAPRPGAPLPPAESQVAPPVAVVRPQV